jgi:hypothetical protein
MMNKVVLYIKKLNTISLVGIFILCGLIFFFIEVISFDKYSGNDIEIWLLVISFFFFGLAGIPIIIRREINIGSLYLNPVLALSFGIFMLLTNLTVSVIFILGVISR